VRAVLDGVYAATLRLSATCLVAIAVLVLAQVLGRLLDIALKLLGLAPVGFIILSLSEIAGYLLAAASFLALAGSLKGGAHIRVTMLLGGVGERLRRVMELIVFITALLFTAYMTYYVATLAFDSWRHNEISPGLVKVQLVWPQAAMAVGLGALVVALADEIGILIREGRPSFRAAEDAVTLGKEG